MRKLIAVLFVGALVSLTLPTVGQAAPGPRGMATKRSAFPTPGMKPGGISGTECTVESTSGAPSLRLDCDEVFPNNEPDIEVDPADPLHMIASSNDYGTCCDQFYTTFDGGQTWTTGNMSNRGPHTIGSDPVTVFDVKNGTAIHPSLSLRGNGNWACDGDLVVSVSEDGGLTWGTPVRVADGVGCDLSKTQFFNDKEWIVTDNDPGSPHYGRTYLTWSRFESHKGAYAASPIFESHSDDGGFTWTQPQEISGSNGALCTFQYAGPSGDCDQNQFSVVTVGPDGTVYVAFENEQNQSLWEGADEFDDQYLLVKSTDGGANWSAPSTVTGLEDGFSDYPRNVSGRQTLTGYQLRVNSAGNILADPTDPTGDTLYLTFSDNRNGTKTQTNTDVFLMTSTDGGANWTSPVQVNDSPTDQWFPWVEVNPVDGTVGIIYNDRSIEDPDLYGATLTEVGIGTGSVSTSLSNPTDSAFFRADVIGCEECATFHGDYIGLAYGSDGAANMVWTDMSEFDTARGGYLQFIHFARGFRTAQQSMLTPVKSGVTVTPLITVGDELASGYRFEAIPDGVGVDPLAPRIADLYVNHETSKAPFPYRNFGATETPTAANGENDFDNAQVSRLTLSGAGRVTAGSFAIASELGYQRFCSSYLATAKEGFSRDILFTNEESPDYFLREEGSWPPPLDNSGAEEGGLVVALDVASGEQHPIYGMGRHNHENSVAIPGYDDLVVMSGDDTFTSGPLTIPPGGPLTATSVPSQSQLYSYIAPNTNALLADEGHLWAFVSDTPDVKNYYDVLPGSGAVVTGHFIQVPDAIATGLNPDGSEVNAADFDYPAPPTNGSWQTDLRTFGPTLAGIDGPQWVLEYWSDLNDVFQFVRVEDIAYDKRPGMGNVVYVVDSGRGRRVDQGLDTPNFKSTNGRVWRMELDPADPTIVTSLTVLVEGDDNPVKTFDEVHQPDNIETTQTGLLLTEDPGSSQQFPVGSADPAATTARLWYVPFVGTPEVVAKVNQSADGGPTDVGPSPSTVSPNIGNQGAWESTGIIDASEAFGPGAFLINIQAHTLWIEKAAGDDNNGDGQPDFTYKREGGQLLLIRIPGI